MKSQQIKTLLIEDDDIDAEAVLRAFQRQQIDTQFKIVSNGLDALKVMRRENSNDNFAWPYLILLDLNMPRMNGFEFLQELRKDERLRRSVVFVLTTSNRYEDKLAAYAHYVAGYFVKSKVGKDYLPVTQLIELYWQLVEFPPMRMDD
ncbi:MAG: response regulator [Caldilineaceae bacterium]